MPLTFLGRSMIRCLSSSPKRDPHRMLAGSLKEESQHFSLAKSWPLLLGGHHHLFIDFLSFLCDDATLVCAHPTFIHIQRLINRVKCSVRLFGALFSIWNLALETYNTRAGSSLAHYETSKVKTCLRLKSFESPWLFSRRRWFGNRKVLLLTGLRHWQPFSCLSLVGEKAQWEWEHPSVIIGPAAREVIK